MILLVTYHFSVLVQAGWLCLIGFETGLCFRCLYVTW